MKRLLYPALVLSMAMPAFLYGHFQKPAADEKKAAPGILSEMMKKAGGNELLLRHMKGARSGKGDAALERAWLAQKVLSDFDLSAVNDKPYLHYAVPAMSELQRLPDAYPFDGEADGTVRIAAAKGEYEPGSFLIYPLKDLGKVSFALTDFRDKSGRAFPKDKIDLKVVKVWYQNKNGWYSYFGDTGFKLCPELLLNDEDLIRVDEEKKANYARLAGKDGKESEMWINPPRQMDIRYHEHYRTTCSFMPMRENFRDAPTLKPVLLEEGAFRNLFITVKVEKGIPDGIYRGGVKLSDSAGKELGVVPVEIRVLPFELPGPKSYFNPEREFITASYSYISLGLIMEENGGDQELAVKQLESVLRNQVEHNQTIHWMRGGLAEVDVTIDAMKRAGMRTDILLGGGVQGGTKLEMENHARKLAEWYDKKVGHHNLYLGFGDEPGAGWLVKVRPTYEAYQKAGFKFIIAGGDSVFYKAGYLYDWHNVAKYPEEPSSTHMWNRLDHAFVAWYATMHIGPENPAFNRRQYGMAPYLAGYSAACNYAHHFGPYNDDSTTYRPMVFAYGTYDGVIDTIQWEGFREGVDDIRYATLMTDLARKASASGDLELGYLGRKALQYLATFKSDSGDLNECRMEMINFIIKLKEGLASKK